MTDISDVIGTRDNFAAVRAQDKSPDFAPLSMEECQSIATNVVSFLDNISQLRTPNENFKAALLVQSSVALFESSQPTEFGLVSVDQFALAAAASIGRSYYKAYLALDNNPITARDFTATPENCVSLVRGYLYQLGENRALAQQNQGNSATDLSNASI